MMGGSMNGSATTKTVIKVGGSLYSFPKLSMRLRELLASMERAVLIPGGGRFANGIRDWEQTHNSTPEQSHQWAIQTMSLVTPMLASLLDNGAVAKSLTEVEQAWEQGDVPVLDVATVPSIQQLPATWNITSDSIAAQIATDLGSRLVLCKSTSFDGIFNRVNLGKCEAVDGAFEGMAKSVQQIGWVNLREVTNLKWFVD